MLSLVYFRGKMSDDQRRTVLPTKEISYDPSDDALRIEKRHYEVIRSSTWLAVQSEVLPEHLGGVVQAGQRLHLQGISLPLR